MHLFPGVLKDIHEFQIFASGQPLSPMVEARVSSISPDRSRDLQFFRVWKKLHGFLGFTILSRSNPLNSIDQLHYFKDWYYISITPLLPIAAYMPPKLLPPARYEHVLDIQPDHSKRRASQGTFDSEMMHALRSVGCFQVPNKPISLGREWNFYLVKLPVWMVFRWILLLIVWTCWLTCFKDPVVWHFQLVQKTRGVFLETAQNICSIC